MAEDEARAPLAAAEPAPASARTIVIKTLVYYLVILALLLLWRDRGLFIYEGF